MSGRLKANAIANGAITALQINSAINDKINAAYTQANTASSTANAAYSQANNSYNQANTANTQAFSLPKIRSIKYPGDDLAANISGGQTLYILGSGFTPNTTVYINNSAVPSVTYINSGNVGITAPALSAATYPVYVINTDDGATAILIPGIQYSGTPSWSTTSPLTQQNSSVSWNIQLVATSDSAVSYSLQAGSSLPAGITLAANGLISGTMTSPPSDDTTYNFTVVANDAELQDSSRAFSVSVTVSILDPYFTYTTLLLHGDGTNNANNHAFLDSSNNNFTITRNGNATQGTFSPFGDNWSYYFDGDADEINAGYNSNLTFGSGNFTIECWVYTQATGIIASIWDDFSSAPQSWTIGSGSRGSTTGSDLRFTIDVGGADTTLLQSSINQPMNQWFHFAVTRNGSNWYMFFNGIQVATASSSATISAGDGTRGLTIGAGGAGTNQSHRWGMNGYISNFRIIKGNALYTSNFTPPTQPLSAVSNTTLLTCQSNAFIDKGPNRYTITPVNNTRVSKFDPFRPYKAIPGSYSVYFDGASDYLDLPANTACAFGTGDFTVECWIRTSTTTSDTFYRRVFMVDGPTGNAGGNFQISMTPTTGYVNVWDSVLDITGTRNVCDGNWHHIATTRSGTTLRLFVDGVLDASTTYSTSVSPNTGSPRPRIGSYDGSGGDFEGYISNLRVVKGTAVYTSAFTPPTTQLTAIANTSLLTCQSTTIIDNSTNGFTITRNGNARPIDLNPFTTTFVSEKYNTANVGGSMYLDGTGDYILTSSTTAMNLGANPFCLEFWFYLNATGATYYGLCGSQTDYKGPSISRYGSVLMYGLSSNGSSWNVMGAEGTTGSTTINPYTWYHLVLCRTGNTISAYINGARDVTVSSAATLVSRTEGFCIGNWFAGVYAWNGYIANPRFIVGSNPYDATQTSITVPTAPVTSIANTQLLCNFTNAGILDSVGKHVLETVGDARVNTSVKKYGTGSMYFDGSGDYLKLPSNDALDLGNGDFTIEFWSYFNSTADSGGLGVGIITNGSNTIYSSVNGGTTLTFYNGSSIVSGTIALSTWQHVAVSRSSGTVRMFINGNQTGSASHTAAVNYSGAFIGTQTAAGGYLNGNIDDLRITKGVARYRYNFTPPIKAFSDGDGNLANNTTDVLVGDQVNTPVFPYTTLLLHGDGTNNANNHAFVDSSNNNFAITRNGNATQGTFSPFSPTGWSAYFDGSGDYVSFGDVLDIGSSNFTFECFVNFSSFASGSYNAIFTKYGADYQYQLLWDVGNSRWFWNINSTVSGNSTVYYNDSLRVGEWYHLAFIKNGTSYSLYRNGVLIGTQTISGDIAGGTRPFTLGMTFGGSNNALYPFHGYISNFRALVGTILYSSNFTPPTTPLTAIANTQLLTVQSNRFIDNSTNAYSPTITGDTSIQAFSPFPPSVEYTANTHGGSAYFDGTGDYLSLADNAAFDVGSGNFTFEFWMYTSVTGSDMYIFGQSNSMGSTATVSYYLYKTSGNKLTLGITNGVSLYAATSTNNLPVNAWVHIACVRDGNTLRNYINGVQDGTADVTGVTAVNSSTQLAIGRLGEYNTSLYSGYISNFRMVVGTCLYTGGTSFTPPTAPTTAIANTQLLCNFTNAGILDSTGKNVLETVGDAKVNTATKVFGTGSMYFDGAGDYLKTRYLNLFHPYQGEYTAEMWVYPVSLSSGGTASSRYGTLLVQQDLGTGIDWGLGFNTSGQLVYTYWNGSATVQLTNSGPTLVANTWSHVGFTYTSSGISMFVNGQVGARTATSGTPTSGSSSVFVGIEGRTGGSELYYNGYIDDLRITKGIARYIYNFTPPTAAFLNK